MTEEEKRVESWVAAHFAQSASPPFSFRYGDKRSAEFIREWQFSQGTRQLDNLHTERIFIYRDPQTDLEVRCKCVLFKDFPAIEWVVRFRNNAQVDTPIIEDIQALNVVFTGQNKSNFILHHALGSSAKRNDFAPIENAPGSLLVTYRQLM